ncbi:MAG: hypothetical protein ACK4R6_00180 [Spirosomataceae bacterium]
MKIVCIFADQLFACHYEGEEDNEYDRLMELWTDVEFLSNYAKENNIPDVRKFVMNVLQGVEQIQNLLEEINQNKKPFTTYFEPLQYSEINRVISLQKGKIRKNILRLYAIKLDDTCFLLTGGAIKMSQTMQGHPDTNRELEKLKQVRAYLKDNGVFDEDSFFELFI